MDHPSKRLRLSGEPEKRLRRMRYDRHALHRRQAVVTSDVVVVVEVSSTQVVSVGVDSNGVPTVTSTLDQSSAAPAAPTASASSPIASPINSSAAPSAAPAPSTSQLVSATASPTPSALPAILSSSSASPPASSSAQSLPAAVTPGPTSLNSTSCECRDMPFLHSRTNSAKLYYRPSCPVHLGIA
jgi:hypothetical protein